MTMNKTETISYANPNAEYAIYRHYCRTMLLVKFNNAAF